MLLLLVSAPSHTQIWKLLVGQKLEFADLEAVDATAAKVPSHPHPTTNTHWVTRIDTAPTEPYVALCIHSHPPPPHLG